jgi:hypothetical protein
VLIRPTLKLQFSPLPSVLFTDPLSASHQIACSGSLSSPPVTHMPSLPMSSAPTCPSGFGQAVDRRHQPPFTLVSVPVGADPSTHPVNISPAQLSCASTSLAGTMHSSRPTTGDVCLAISLRSRLSRTSFRSYIAYNSVYFILGPSTCQWVSQRNICSVNEAHIFQAGPCFSDLECDGHDLASECFWLLITCRSYLIRQTP